MSVEVRIPTILRAYTGGDKIVTGEGADLRAIKREDVAAYHREVYGTARYVPIDDSAFVEALTGAGVARDYADFLASIFHPVREGWTAAVTDHVQTLTGHAPRSLATYVRDNAQRLR